MAMLYNTGRVARALTCQWLLYFTAGMAMAAEPAATNSADVTTSPTPAHWKVILSEEPAPANGPAISLAGVVVSPDGKPIAGATVVLRAKLGGQFYSMGLSHNRDILARTATSPDGRFIFSIIPIPPRMDKTIRDLEAGKGGAEILAWADGFGLTFADVNRLRDKETVRLQLSPEAKVSAKVRDVNDAVVPHARFKVWGLTPAAGNYDAFLDSPGDLNLNLSQLYFGGVADESGEVSLPHLPVGYRVIVGIQCPGFARRVCAIDTGSGDGAKQLTSNQVSGDPLEVLKPPLQITLKSGRYLKIKVTDQEGQAVHCGGVQLIDAERHWVGSEPVGSDGTANIEFSKPGKLEITYFGDPLSPALSHTVNKEVADNETAAVVEIHLPASRWFSGQVVDSDSGTPVPGTYLVYHLKDSAPPVASIAVSGADGSFHIPVLAGAGALSFQFGVHGYFVPQALNRNNRNAEPPSIGIEVPDSGEIAPVTVSLAHGLVVSGTVSGPDGSPVAYASVHANSQITSAVTKTDSAGHYEFSGLSPYEDWQLTFSSASGGGEESIGADQAHPWNKTRRMTKDIELRPGISLTGRVLKDKQPQVGVKMFLYRSAKGNGNRMSVFSEVETDAEGRYVIGGLGGGDQYYFEVKTPDGSVDPKWEYQAPFVDSIPANAKDEIKLPDVNLIGASQTLRGVVVDPSGHPVAGVAVSDMLALAGGQARMIAMPEFGRNGATGRTFTSTDSEGHFDLAGLPSQKIELMVYKRNPRGGRIEHPSKSRPELNQQDIRIIYDPALDVPIEDLDQKPAH